MGINADLTARARAVSPSWLVQYYDEPLAIEANRLLQGLAILNRLAREEQDDAGS